MQHRQLPGRLHHKTVPAAALRAGAPPQRQRCAAHRPLCPVHAARLLGPAGRPGAGRPPPPAVPRRPATVLRLLGVPRPAGAVERAETAARRQPLRAGQYRAQPDTRVGTSGREQRPRCRCVGNPPKYINKLTDEELSKRVC